jgi:hypothetical protein
MKDVKFDERELAEIFQVEELEKRYEMGWISGVEVKVEISNGSITPSIALTL